MYYIYKDKYNKEINSLDTKNREKLDCKKLRLKDYLFQEKQDEKQEEIQDQKQDQKQEEIQEEMQDEKQEIQEKPITDPNKFKEWIDKKETDINNELFTKHFNCQRPSDMLNHLYKINDINNNSKLVHVIISGLKDLKKEIKEMSEKERKIEKPGKVVTLVEEILRFNKQKQEGQGIKILTPSHMLSRLPISLGQLEAGNNSEKLKNEIRQLLYSLYHSKNITKQLYNNLMKPI